MRKWLIWLVVGAFVLGACAKDDSGGEPSDDAKATLTSAFEKLSEQQGGTITINLASTPESLAAVSDGDVTEDQANTILGSSITFQGNGADDPADQTARVAVDLEGTDGAELQVIGGDLYVRIDLPGIASKFGVDTSEFDQQAAAAQKRGFDFVQPFVNGETIKISGLQDALSGLTGGAATPSGGLGEQEQQLLNQFSQTIKDAATVTSEGTDDVGEHLVASVPLKTLADSFVQALGPLASQLPPGAAPDTSDIPEGDLALDVWVNDGTVSQIEFDFTQIGQFSDEAKAKLDQADQLALRLTFSDEVPDLTAPDFAAEVTQEDIQQIAGLLMQGVTGVPGGVAPINPGGGGGGAPAIDCSLYKGLPPETFAGLPQETLDQIEAICPGVIPK